MIKLKRILCMISLILAISVGIACPVLTFIYGITILTTTGFSILGILCVLFPHFTTLLALPFLYAWYLFGFK